MQPPLTLPPLAVLGAGAALVLILALAILSASMKERAIHKRRLARVSRMRLSGQIDMDDARRSLLRAEEDTSLLVRLTHALARIIPLLDTVRLRANLTRAGLSLTISGFVLLSLLIAVILVGIGAIGLGMPAPLLAPPAVIIGMLAMNSFVGFRGDLMASRFMKQLPDVLDSVIRGVRSGLPVIECIGVAGREASDPIGPHFRAVGERVQLGETLESALWRMARVVDRPEVDFLAVSISIQQETGGSLAEALGNLAELLRKREHLKLKIKAISSEAKASAMIIGALPFAMLALLTFVSPDYVMPLYIDPRGQIMLGCAFGSISVGAYIMWRMTQFEI